MSQDPKQSPPPAARQTEVLEDLIYKSSLSGGNKAIQGTNPLIAIPTTILTYTAVALGILFVATKTEAGRKVMGVTESFSIVDLKEKIQDEEPPPPPPPAPPPAAITTRVKDDTPPPPPPSDSLAIPDDAPSALLKIDQSKSGLQLNTGETGTGSPTGASATTLDTPTFHRTQQDVIHNVALGQVGIAKKGPAPVTSAMAKRARISGTVVVELTIGPNGVPVSAKAVSGHQLLQQSAIDAAMNWRFHPYMVDGVAQSARFTITFNFL